MPEPSRPTDPLVRSARTLISDAVSAWASHDHAKTLMLAPIAAEHLAKAALWSRNPVLLAPLERNHEATFVALATKPDPLDPQLRTIGLSTALSRASRVYEAATPLDEKRSKRLAECRGGAVHIGQFTAENAEHVLADVLALFQWFAPLMGLEPAVLYGKHREVVEGILDDRRTSTQRAVDRRIAAARDRLSRIERAVGPELTQDTFAQKESMTTEQVSRRIREVAVGADRPCPVCQRKGMVLGEVERDAYADEERGRDGVEYNFNYEYLLIPDSFYCNVCGLTLNTTEELAMCGLPDTKFKLESDEITDELIAYADDQDAWLASFDD